MTRGPSKVNIMIMALSALGSALIFHSYRAKQVRKEIRSSQSEVARPSVAGDFRQKIQRPSTVRKVKTEVESASAKRSRTAAMESTDINPTPLDQLASRISAIQKAGDPFEEAEKTLVKLRETNSFADQVEFLEGLRREKVLNVTEMSRIAQREFFRVNEASLSEVSEPAREAATVHKLFSLYLDSKTESDLRSGINQETTFVEIYSDLIGTLSEHPKRAVRDKIIKSVIEEHPEMAQLAAAFPDADLSE